MCFGHVAPRLSPQGQRAASRRRCGLWLRFRLFVFLETVFGSVWERVLRRALRRLSRIERGGARSSRLEDALAAVPLHWCWNICSGGPFGGATRIDAGIDALQRRGVSELPWRELLRNMCLQNKRVLCSCYREIMALWNSPRCVGCRWTLVKRRRIEGRQNCDRASSCICHSHGMTHRRTCSS
jgi:hypothetical protein